MSQCTACAASNMAIGDAMDEIRVGRADVMFAGGTEAPITQVGIAGFDAMRALSRRNDDPERASRPFEKDRDGLVMGEAAAVLVLEELEHARARGAKIYAELLGYGMSADASHMTEPDPTGVNPARAMTMALADAGVDPTEIGLRERPRDVDSARRLRRDACDQACARRGARATPRRLVDEGRDRALLRRSRRRRGGLHGAGRDATGVAPPTINYDDVRPRLRSRLRPERGARASRPARRRSRTRSASAATTRRSSSAASRTEAVRNPVPAVGPCSEDAQEAARIGPADRIADVRRRRGIGRIVDRVAGGHVSGTLSSGAAPTFAPCASSTWAAAWSSCRCAVRSVSAATGSSSGTGCPPELVVRPRASEAEIDAALAEHLPWLERQLARAARSPRSGSTGCGSPRRRAAARRGRGSR